MRNPQQTQNARKPPAQKSPAQKEPAKQPDANQKRKRADGEPDLEVTEVQLNKRRCSGGKLILFFSF